MRARPTATIIRVSNPFDPLGSKVADTLRSGRSIRSYAPDWGDAPYICTLNGVAMLRADWTRRVRKGDTLIFTKLPRGGEGGGSKTVAIVALIALAVVAPMIGTAVAGAVLPATASAAAVAAVSAGTAAAVTLAGSALVNAMTPVPDTGGRNLSAPSPTYSIQAQGNTARIEQPIPVQYGRVKLFPDFAATPFAHFDGGDQFISQLLCVGQGEYDIHQILIEDTPIENFSEIEYEIIPPGQDIDLFPAAVTTSTEVSGQQFGDLDYINWSQSGTTITISSIGNTSEVATGSGLWLNFTSATTGTAPTSGAYTVTSMVDAETARVTASTSATASGSGTLHPLLGDVNGFTANAAGTKAYKVFFDFVWPRGLFLSNEDGDLTPLSTTVRIQVRQVDDAGTAIGSWITLDDYTVTAKDMTPQRKSKGYALPFTGRFRAQCWRTDDRNESTSAGHEVAWAGLRAHLRGPDRWPGKTLLAVRMKASNNLSLQASRKVAVVATRKLRSWDGNSWRTPDTTRSIAWAIADIATNATYGCGLPDSKVDLAALRTLDGVWSDRGDRFDGRFDQAGTAWDALQKVAFAGRARVFMQGGKLRVVRDAPASTPVAQFGMRNIKKGSFSLSYVMETEATADTIEATYLDGSSWQPNRVVASIGTAAAKRVKVDFFGITARDHATREALFQAACNRYRRRIVRFETEMEGYIPVIGDLIGISHDAPGWGIHTEAVGWDGDNLILTNADRIVFNNDSDHYVWLRRKDGSSVGPIMVQAIAGDEYKMRLETAPGLAIQTAGTEMERTHVSFGGLNTALTKAKVLRVTPRGMYHVLIEAVVEDPAVHTAKNGKEVAPLRTSLLPKVPKLPVVKGLSARAVSKDRCAFAWDPATGADSYELDFASGTDPDDPDSRWTGGGVTHVTTYTANLLYGAKTLVRVRALGLMPGPWMVATVGDLLGYQWSAATATTMWSASMSTRMWSAY